MQAMKEQKLKEERMRAEHNPALQKKLEEKLEREEKKKRLCHASCVLHTACVF